MENMKQIEIVLKINVQVSLNIMTKALCLQKLHYVYFWKDIGFIFYNTKFLN